MRHATIVAVLALLAGQALASHDKNPFGGWVGTYYGSCIQYAYWSSDSQSWECSDYPIAYPYWVTISKEYDSHHNWQYYFSWWNDKTEIYHDGYDQPWEVPASSYSHLPLFYDYYKHDYYCVHYEDSYTHNKAYFKARVDKKEGQYVFTQLGYFYDSPYNGYISICPKSKDLNWGCDHSGFYYKCTAYKWSKKH